MLLVIEASTVTDISTTCTAAIFIAKVSCIMSVDGTDTETVWLLLLFGQGRFPLIAVVFSLHTIPTNKCKNDLQVTFSVAFYQSVTNINKLFHRLFFMEPKCYGSRNDITKVPIYILNSLKPLTTKQIT